MSGRLRHVPFQVLLIEFMLRHANRTRYGKWTSRVQQNRKDEHGKPMKPSRERNTTQSAQSTYTDGSTGETERVRRARIPLAGTDLNTPNDAQLSPVTHPLALLPSTPPGDNTDAPVWQRDKETKKPNRIVCTRSSTSTSISRNTKSNSKGSMIQSLQGCLFQAQAHRTPRHKAIGNADVRKKKAPADPSRPRYT